MKKKHANIPGKIRVNLKMFVVTLLLFSVCFTNLYAQSYPSSLPEIKYHLTSPDWKPLQTDSNKYLDAVADMVAVAQRFQNTDGAIIDPYLHREHQYSTPYYAMAVGVLVSSGRGETVVSSGIQAMDKALKDFSNGKDSIPDQHGEFYIAALAEAVELYKEHISQDKYDAWKEMMSTPLENIWDGMSSHLNNWRTYAMKGEWTRAKNGFIEKQKAIELIEESWKNYTQYERIGPTKWNLYEDWSSDPQSLAVEAVGRGNLTALALNGYDGPSGNQMRDIVRKGGRTSMLLMSPTGQCPPNGRTDNHVFNDILYQLIFEALAEDAYQNKDIRLAGQYRRSALLAFQSIERWKRTDERWNGSYSIAKNHFDPGNRLGYQPASQWGNYSGAMMFHLAEAFLTNKTEIKEVPSPTEIGGYALHTENRFSTFTANASGMQVFINLRGASAPKYDMYWTPLGAVRFSKMNWDDRLGPSDGKRLNALKDPVLKAKQIGEFSQTIYPQTGLTFGPTWLHKGKWVRIADMATNYRGVVTTEFTHPLLVKFSITYATVNGTSGPIFKQDFVVTPDGVMTYLSSVHDLPYGINTPLLSNDGRPLQTEISNGIATTGFQNEGDTQNFIGLNDDIEVTQDGEPINSTYGTLLPIKFQSKEKRQIVFVYPKSKTDPEAIKVKESFTLHTNGFSSLLGKVEGTIYVGKKMAGGYGSSLDLDGDGKAELVFEKSCGFIAQLTDGKIIKIETDTAVSFTINEKKINANAYEPITIE